MYKRILVPVDGSETSNKALVTALQFARDFGGRVRLVHVMEELTYLTAYDPYGYSGDLVTVMRETGEKILDQGMAMAQSAGVEADSMLFDKSGERLAETVADTWRWMQSGGMPVEHPRWAEHGIDPTKEAKILAALGR